MVKCSKSTVGGVSETLQSWAYRNTAHESTQGKAVLPVSWQLYSQAQVLNFSTNYDVVNYFLIIEIKNFTFQPTVTKPTKKVSGSNHKVQDTITLHIV